MLKLYAIPVSLYCAKLRIVLRHKGLDWQEVPPPGGYGSAEYKALVPAGNLPALRHDDLLLSDSEAIAEYLNELHPDPAMLPDRVDLRAKARERSRFHDTRLEPALRAVFREIPAASRDQDAILEGGKVLSRHLETLSRLLTDAPPEGELWLGDCGFAISFEWIDALEAAIGLRVTWPETVLSYRSALRMHPAVIAEIDDYLPKLRAYLKEIGRVPLLNAVEEVD